MHKFYGRRFFQTQQPFDPSNFVHFRKRIGENWLEFLLGQSVSLHPKAKTEDEVRVQEKNIAFPTDSKMAKKEGVIQRQKWQGRSSEPLAKECFGNWKENFLQLF
ncbi:MAG: hypothetical protein J6O88_04375 [Chryseobacterium sp.]|uniref:hypothetical protein n=1 Tax=Chryseobacterium sp. TaxID=1871047 RepID=UPI001B11630E|nr:hypothetical protein [Chryseobacterium sp.]MBO6183917.1 hypothetical protein [Chryseobacterium sp.]